MWNGRLRLKYVGSVAGWSDWRPPSIGQRPIGERQMTPPPPSLALKPVLIVRFATKATIPSSLRSARSLSSSDNFWYAVATGSGNVHTEVYHSAIWIALVCFFNWCSVDLSSNRWLPSTFIGFDACFDCTVCNKSDDSYLTPNCSQILIFRQFLVQYHKVQRQRPSRVCQCTIWISSVAASTDAVLVWVEKENSRWLLPPCRLCSLFYSAACIKSNDSFRTLVRSLILAFWQLLVRHHHWQR